MRPYSGKRPLLGRPGTRNCELLQNEGWRIMNLKSKLDFNSGLKPAILVLICILCLAPFLDKAFHIDDPVFIWVARQIQAHPLDFYGFTVNWNGTEMPMWTRNQNPPLVSYYIALITYLFGCSEIILHVAFLVPAVAVILGTYSLAKALCQKPFVATLVSMSTPVFLVSSTTVMCDIMMLSLWVWAVYFWICGIKNNSRTNLIVSSLLVAASILTKYYAVCLIPLLFAYSYAEKRKLGYWMSWLLIPVVVLAIYQWRTYSLYGSGLFFNAISYSKSSHGFQLNNLFSRSSTGLAFTGGCLASILFFCPILWQKKTIAMGICLTLLCYLISTPYEIIGNLDTISKQNINWLMVAQSLIFIFAGINLIAVVIVDLWISKDSSSVLLFLWVVGTLIFASHVNWSINGRSILPMVPAFGISLIRHFDRSGSSGFIDMGSWRILVPLTPAFVIALCVTWADYTFAESARNAAITIHNTYKGAPGKLWFQGHWGFQYYMEQFGAKAFDSLHSEALAKGDVVIVPANSSRMIYMPRDSILFLQQFQFPIGNLTILNQKNGAGFYCDAWGTLPFAIGPESFEQYFALQVTK
jgi:hypothetical protein